jgi:hypothetical protein
MASATKAKKNPKSVAKNGKAPAKPGEKRSMPRSVSPLLTQDEALKKLVAVKSLVCTIEQRQMTQCWAIFDVVGFGEGHMTNRFTPEAMDQMAIKQAGEDVVLAPRVPHQEMMGHAHIIKGRRRFEDNDTNQYGFKALALKKSLARGVFRAKLHRNMKDFASFIDVDGPYSGLIPIEGPPPTLDRRHVTLHGPNPVTSLAYRPMFHTWRCKVHVGFYPLLINIKTITTAFQLANDLVGVGSNRVENWGECGQFRVNKITVLANEEGWRPAHYHVTEEKDGVIDYEEVRPAGVLLPGTACSTTGVTT